MESLDDTERAAIGQLFQNALTKLKILSLNPSNYALMDPSNTYSIGVELEQKIFYLEEFDQLTSESETEQSTKSTVDSQEDCSGNVFSYWQFSKLMMEIISLEKKLVSMRNTFNEMHEELYKRSQLEIARNRLVVKWESSRQEQLIQTINIRAENFRTQTELQETQVESGLKAARKVDEYYNGELARVEGDINDWMDRFDREKDQIDTRHQKARARKRNWDELKAEVEQRKAKITQLEELESVYLKDAEHKRLCRKYAVKLQAWWRGVMVRKGLGPYSKSKKKKTKGIKGAKGKGKKSKK